MTAPVPAGEVVERVLAAHFLTTRGCRCGLWVRAYGEDDLDDYASDHAAHVAQALAADNLLAVPAGDGDREALGEVLARADEYDYCHERVRDWEAREPSEREHDGEPHDDREQAEWWNRRADAALAWMRRRGVTSG